jgi:hypothetical protein
MGVTIPPESKSQPTAERDDEYAHEAVTIAPPAPNFEDMLRHLTPPPSLSNREQPFRAALEAGARAGSSLSELSKIVSELSGGLMGARQANENLVQELATLRALLGSANETQLSLKHRVAELEQELFLSRARAEEEHRLLSEQHDDFLAALLEEHEQALAQARESDTQRTSTERSELAQKLLRAEAAQKHAESEHARAREGLTKAQTQRDEAQARAERLERERDELRAEASLLRARLGSQRSVSTVPPPPVVSRPPSFYPPPALQLDAGELDSTLHTRSLSPRLPSVRPRLTPAPAELKAAVVSSAGPPISRSTSTSMAREFPRESTRPGVGGPKPTEPPPPADFGPPPSGWTPIPPAPEPSRVPRQAVISAASLGSGPRSSRNPIR